MSRRLTTGDENALQLAVYLRSHGQVGDRFSSGASESSGQPGGESDPSILSVSRNVALEHAKET